MNVKRIKPSRLEPKLNRIEEVKKILDRAYGLAPITKMGAAPQRVDMCDVDGIARQIDEYYCQLFPQPLEKLGCELIRGRPFTLRFPGKSQPLDDKELAKLIEIETVKYMMRLGFMIKMPKKLSRVILALLQPKIEEARRQERERISKLLDDMSMICPKVDQCSACEEFRQALKGEK